MKKTKQWKTNIKHWKADLEQIKRERELTKLNFYFEKVKKSKSYESKLLLQKPIPTKLLE